ncbi:ABC transporter ATP-binding protein [Paenibacillus sp. DMB20]|uniref:ABC transporter ATP-binding protein n=1 Tax=Paenibacillus sp. DMB20 TaxID=1642570 RepID=UPI000628066E|nr:ABC transporter ATP-binding protein [Paenibacillus sp. DMB20]KKO53896.1 hypothetical protein XI25_09820 [Paenibacillus sp. DMB20]
MNALEVNKLRKRYGETYVVNGVTFEVKQGELFGFLGKNGAGKSTTIHMLTGIIRPTEGSFSIMGKDYTQMDQIKRRIGVMPDAANYYYDTSALSHLIFFSELKRIPWKRDELVRLLESVGLKGHERSKVKGFSFGMKKKLGLAQALLGDPELLFLDEPTSGLDPESAVAIQQIIRDLNRRNKTIFLTSHNLREVEQLCSRIAIMDKGCITKYGTMEDLRNQYRQHIELSCKISPMSPAQEQQIKKQLINIAGNIVIAGTSLTCTVPEEEDIPLIVTALVDNRIRLYKIEPKPVTLEDIFFNIPDLA